MPPNVPENVRNPERVPLPVNIEALRANLPGLNDTWTAFRGSPKISAENKQLIEKYAKDHPENIQGEVQSKNIHELQRTLVARERTFELIGMHNQLYAVEQRMRWQIARPNALNQDQKRELDMLRRFESIWSVGPRMIRRSLETLDRYLVIKNTFNYPGLTEDAAQRKIVTELLQRATKMMNDRVIGSERGNGPLVEDADDRMLNLLVDFPMQVDTLYRDFIDRAIQANAAARRAGNLSNDQMQRLEEESGRLVFEHSSYQFYNGLYQLQDLRSLAIPELAPARIANDELQAPAQLIMNTEAGRKLVDGSIERIASGFREHFDLVLGRRQPGAQGQRQPLGLFEQNLGIHAEQLYTEQGRMRLLRICDGLAHYRGGVRQGARKMAVAGAGLLGLRDQADAVLPQVRTAEEYRREIMDPILTQLGLPPGFDFSDRAWEQLQKDPVAKEKFEKAMQSVAKILEESRKGVSESIGEFERGMAMLPILRRKTTPEIVRNARPDEVWKKQHAGNLTAADIENIDPQNGAQLLAAHELLLEHLGRHWAQYTIRMDSCAERILGNVNVHIAMEKRLNDAADGMIGEDNTLLYIVFGALGYSILGKYGRHGGRSGKAGPVGFFGALWSPMTYGRFNPIAVANGITRPLGGWYLERGLARVGGAGVNLVRNTFGGSPTAGPASTPPAVPPESPDTSETARNTLRTQLERQLGRETFRGLCDNLSAIAGKIGEVTFNDSHVLIIEPTGRATFLPASAGTTNTDPAWHIIIDPPATPNAAPGLTVKGAGFPSVNELLSNLTEMSAESLRSPRVTHRTAATSFSGPVRVAAPLTALVAPPSVSAPQIPLLGSTLVARAGTTVPENVRREYLSVAEDLVREHRRRPLVALPDADLNNILRNLPEHRRRAVLESLAQERSTLIPLERATPQQKRHTISRLLRLK